jgi:hypothetical protein
MKISEPPYFGVSPAVAGVAAPSIAANKGTKGQHYLYD